MIKKTIVAILAAMVVLCFAMPAAAESFVSEDGVLSIDLPNENWKQIEDVTKWLTFSDGANQITVEHYSNGENLPAISVADSHYVNVFQAAFSTQNEVFIVTGSVVDAAKIPEITQAIMSLKVLKYDTKRAVGTQPEAAANDITVIPLDKTMYVTADSLNVRKGCSTDTQLLGGYKKGSAVKVTGSVQRNGADLGWYQVNYEGGTGYVSGEFLSDTAPASTDSSSGSGSDSDSSVYTGNVITVYDEEGSVFTLYEGTDGYWRDKSGTSYIRLSETVFQVNEGTKRLTTYDASADQDEVEVNVEGDPYDRPSLTVYDELGDSYWIYEGSDGYWHEDDGTAYVRLSATEFQAYEGMKRLSTQYPSYDDQDDADDDDYDDTYEDDDQDVYDDYDDQYDDDDYEEDFYNQPSMEFEDDNGEFHTVYQGSDGIWRTEDGTVYDVEDDD